MVAPHDIVHPGARGLSTTGPMHHHSRYLPDRAVNGMSTGRSEQLAPEPQLLARHLGGVLVDSGGHSVVGPRTTLVGRHRVAHTAARHLPSHRGTVSVRLYLNPRNDPVFVTDARAALRESLQPSQMQALLRQRYPAVTVARSDRSDVRHDSWYIYRDGVWVDDGVLT